HVVEDERDELDLLVLLGRGLVLAAVLAPPNVHRAAGLLEDREEVLAGNQRQDEQDGRAAEPDPDAGAAAESLAATVFDVGADAPGPPAHSRVTSRADNAHT